MLMKAARGTRADSSGETDRERSRFLRDTERDGEICTLVERETGSSGRQTEREGVYFVETEK